VRIDPTIRIDHAERARVHAESGSKPTFVIVCAA
jgi:hypothetical protein